jgi:hypothetical protein
LITRVIAGNADSSSISERSYPEGSVMKDRLDQGSEPELPHDTATERSQFPTAVTERSQFPIVATERIVMTILDTRTHEK